MSLITTDQEKCFILELPKFRVDFDIKTIDLNRPDDVWNGVRNYKIDLPELSSISYEYREPPQAWLTHKLPEYYIKPHIDTDRDAVLIIPIDPKHYNIHFLSDISNEESIIYTHQYRCPTMPHAKIPHFIDDMNVERFFIQVSFYFKDFNWERLHEDFALHYRW